VRLDIVNQRPRTVARASIDVLWRRGDGTGAPAAAFELVGLPL
jgi:hypothetical protein